MFLTVPLSIVRSFSLYTQQWYMSYRFADSLRSSCQQTCMTYTIAYDQAVSKPVWHTRIPLPCVQRKTPDDGHRNCPKHAEFHSKNKFEKLVHLVGFILRIYQDTRSHERQNPLHCHPSIFYLVFLYSLFLTNIAFAIWFRVCRFYLPPTWPYHLIRRDFINFTTSLYSPYTPSSPAQGNFTHLHTLLQGYPTRGHICKLNRTIV